MDSKVTRALTPKQAAVYEYIRARIAETGRSPRLWDIAVAFGWRSDKAASRHIDILVRKRLLMRVGRGSTRQLKLVDRTTYTVEWLVPPEHPGRLGAP